MSYERIWRKWRMIRDIRAYRKQLNERNIRLKKRHDLIKANLEYMQGLQHPDVYVRVDKPDQAAIDVYKEESVGYREFLFASALRGAAILEGARQANYHLENLGMLQLDMSQIESVTKDVSKLSALWTLLANTNIPDSLREKTFEMAASAIFGPGHAQNNLSEMFRNLSKTEVAPYGMGNLVRLSDPDFIKKASEARGKPFNVVKPGNIPRIDELAQDAKRERRARLNSRL